MKNNLVTAKETNVTVLERIIYYMTLWYVMNDLYEADQFNE